MLVVPVISYMYLFLLWNIIINFSFLERQAHTLCTEHDHSTHFRNKNMLRLQIFLQMYDDV